MILLTAVDIFLDSYSICGFANTPFERKQDYLDPFHCEFDLNSFQVEQSFMIRLCYYRKISTGDDNCFIPAKKKTTSRRVYFRFSFTFNMNIDVVIIKFVKLLLETFI